ncbi:MAG: hypothetical protein ABIT96_11215 [Ferruginibacter sp.]
MKTVFYLSLIFFIQPFVCASQDLALSPENLQGLWKGHISTNEKRLPYEIVITMDSGRLSGYSYISFDVEGREVVSVKKMDIKIKKNEVVIEDAGMLYNNFVEDAPKKIKQINTLALTGNNIKLLLTGNFETKVPKSMRKATGVVYLEKKKSTADTKLLAKLDDLKLSGSISFLLPDKDPDEALTASVIPPEPVKQKPVTIAAASTTIVQDPLPAVKEDVVAKTAPSPVVNTSEVPGKAVKNIVINPSPASVLTSTASGTSVESLDKSEEILALLPRAIIDFPVASKAFITRNILPPVRLKLLPAQDVTASVNRKVGTYATGLEPAATSASLPRNTDVPTKTVAAASELPIKTIPKTQPAPVKALVNIAVAPDLDLAKRTIETIDNLIIEADSLQFTLYDNGEVDGDTVSIILNGKTIVYRQGLTIKAFTKTVYITPDMGDSVQLVMYAENLGSIPPNTGLLVLQYDKQRREIRFSGDLNKNAAITLRRKQPGL